MDDKYTGGDIHVKGPFWEKLDNFWYYNKWKIVAAIFIVFVLGVCIFQSCTKEEYDASVLYAGPYVFDAEERDKGAEEIASLLPRDFDGNGKKSVALISYNILTKDQIEGLRKQLEDGEILDTGYFTQESELYNAAIMTGEYSILLLDPAQYQRLLELGRLRKLSDVLATVPACAIDEHGIRFADTALYHMSEELGKLPKDTILCMLSANVFGSKTTYARMTELFVTMATDYHEDAN